MQLPQPKTDQTRLSLDCQLSLARCYSADLIENRLQRYHSSFPKLQLVVDGNQPRHGDTADDVHGLAATAIDTSRNKAGIW